MRESRCIVPFLLLWGLVPPAAEAQESEELFRFFRATPPWAAEAPDVARARFGLGLDLFFERQESLRIASQEKMLWSRDMRSGREESTFLREDPALLNRKFDILLELEGGGSELSVPLPSVPRLNLYPSLVLQAAAADVRLDFLDRTRAVDSTSYDGWGSLFGTGLDVTASLCGSCPWFAAASYRYQKIPSHHVDRSSAFSPNGFAILEDETRLEREVHEVSARAGYSFPGNRIASYVGVRHRSTTLEVDDELRFRDPSGTTETHISTRSKLDSEATLALAGLEAHLAGPFYARIDTAVGNEDRMVSAKVAYLVPRKRVRITKEDLIWPTLSDLLENGPRFYQRKGFVAGFGVVAGGWPVTVGLEIEREGLLLLTVTTQGGEKQESWLSGSETIILESKFGGPQPGMFSIEAFTSRKKKRPVDFIFHRLEAGPGEAVSVAFRDGLQPGMSLAQAAPAGTTGRAFFGPPTIRVSQGGLAKFRFYAAKDFTLVKASIQHRSRPDAFSIPVWEEKLRCAPVERGEECNGDWNGRDSEKKEVSKGLHTLQIYLWNSADLKNWEAASSAGAVQVDP